MKRQLFILTALTVAIVVCFVVTTVKFSENSILLNLGNNQPAHSSFPAIMMKRMKIAFRKAVLSKQKSSKIDSKQVTKSNPIFSTKTLPLTSIPSQSLKTSQSGDRAISQRSMPLNSAPALSSFVQMKNLDGNLNVLQNFVNDQRTLDQGKTILQRQNLDLALGDGLAAQLELKDSKVGGESTDSKLASAVHSADAALASAGFGGSADNHRDSELLFGKLSGKQLRREMAIDGTRIDPKTLSHALELSEHELRDVLSGTPETNSNNFGLSQLAVDSMAKGFENDLSMTRRDPISGETSGSLSLMNDGISRSIESDELRSLFGGKLSLGATMVGLGSLPVSKDVNVES